MNQSSDFGDHIRARREALLPSDGRFSLRRLAAAVGIEPSYLSKIERGLQPPPGERTIIALARELGEDPDVLLAMAGKVSEDLQSIIRARPVLFASLLRQLKNAPEISLKQIVHEAQWKTGEGQ